MTFRRSRTRDLLPGDGRAATAGHRLCRLVDVLIYSSTRVQEAAVRAVSFTGSRVASIRSTLSIITHFSLNSRFFCRIGLNFQISVAQREGDREGARTEGVRPTTTASLALRGRSKEEACGVHTTAVHVGLRQFVMMADGGGEQLDLFFICEKLMMSKSRCSPVVPYLCSL